MWLVIDQKKGNTRVKSVNNRVLELYGELAGMVQLTNKSEVLSAADATPSWTMPHQPRAPHQYKYKT